MDNQKKKKKEKERRASTSGESQDKLYCFIFFALIRIFCVICNPCHMLFPLFGETLQCVFHN